ASAVPDRDDAATRKAIDRPWHWCDRGRNHPYPCEATPWRTGTPATSTPTADPSGAVGVRSLRPARPSSNALHAAANERHAPGVLLGPISAIPSRGQAKNERRLWAGIGGENPMRAPSRTCILHTQDLVQLFHNHRYGIE